MRGPEKPGTFWGNAIMDYPPKIYEKVIKIYESRIATIKDPSYEPAEFEKEVMTAFIY